MTPARQLAFLTQVVVMTAAVADSETRCPPGTPLMRLTPPAYGDGISSPRTAADGGELPSARLISNLVCRQTESIPSRRALAAMVFQWGQFLDHDITLVHSGGAFLPIEVPVGDPQFDPFSNGGAIIPMTRSLGTGTPLQQINEITSLIDGSVVYGSDPVRVAALRSFENGELRTTVCPDGEMPPYNDLDPPIENANENRGLSPEELFIAGDVRSNEQSGLLAMHTLFLREHNRLAREISAADPGLTDEEIFVAARRRLTAIIQSITYHEFLPAVLGTDALPAYAGFVPEVDPCISNEFATAAFRIGHSMLPPMLPRMDEGFREHAAGHLSLASAYFVPHEVADMGITPYLRGLACVPLQSIDRMVVDEVRNMLFGPPGAGGLDLAALNIQRGRDHGLGSYNAVRTGLGLAAATGFADITTDSGTASALSDAYGGKIEDVDMWIGGMSEDHLPGAMLGETFFEIWVDQFRRLRDGDPCWFENTDSETNPGHLAPSEIGEIRATRLADIIARNSDWSGASSVASVFGLPAPTLVRFEPDPASGRVTLEWSSFLNADYEIEAADHPGAFEGVMTLSGTEGTTAVTFTDEAGIGAPRRFYRITVR